jgi:hypothetical protein
VLATNASGRALFQIIWLRFHVDMMNHGVSRMFTLGMLVRALLWFTPRLRADKLMSKVSENKLWNEMMVFTSNISHGDHW